MDIVFVFGSYNSMIGRQFLDNLYLFLFFERYQFYLWGLISGVFYGLRFFLVFLLVSNEFFEVRFYYLGGFFFSFFKERQLLFYLGLGLGLEGSDV